MSKNFAEEYKALTNEELPDLWNRIEAGLTPKTTALAEEAEDIQDINQPPKETHPEEKPEKAKVISFLFRYRTAVAAALCVVVILPAAILLGRINRPKSSPEFASDTAAPMNNAATTEMWDDVAEEAAEAAEEPEEFETGAAAAEDMTDGTIADMADALSADMDEAAVKEMQGDRSSSGAISEAEADDVSEEMEAFFDKQKNDQLSNAALSREEKKEYGKAEKIFERITIEAAEQTGETLQTDKDFYYGVEMKVISDPSGELQEGTKITVWVSMFSSIAYMPGEEYELDLSYDPHRECPYQVKKTYFS